MSKPEKANFVGLFLRVLTSDYQDLGWKAFRATYLVACAGCGVAFALWMPEPSTVKADLLIVLAALVTAQGIILALTIASAQHTLTVISRPGFSAYLRRNGVLDHYLVCTAIMQWSGVLAMLSLIGTMGLLVFKPTDGTVLRIGLGLSLSTLLYSVRWISGGSVMVRDLIWYNSLYEESMAGSDKEGGDVLPFGDRAVR